jgi:hypothetical protein
MFRRLVAIAAACGVAIGLTMGAMPAKAAVTHIPSDPGPVGLLRVCVIVSAADSGLCIHV